MFAGDESFVTDIEADGSFKFRTDKGEGIPPGNYNVTIGLPRNRSSDFSQYKVYKPEDFPNIPMKYQEEDTSGFTAVVKKGSNEPFNFDMK